MRIGDLGNPYKDTPGKGRFAGNVYIYLERGRQDGTWHISAFSHNVSGANLPDVAAMWQRLDRLLPDIATDVEDKSAKDVRRLAVERSTNDIQAAARDEDFASKQQEEVKRVSMHGGVIEEQQSLDAPVQREHVTAGRIPISKTTDANIGDVFHEQDINVPVVGEEIVVGKRVREVEEVRLRKEAVTEDQQGDDTVRKERVYVDSIGAD